MLGSVSGVSMNGRRKVRASRNTARTVRVRIGISLAELSKKLGKQVKSYPFAAPLQRVFH